MSATSPAPRAALVVLAAGEGRRVGHETNKVLLPLAGRPVLAWSLRHAGQAAGLGPVVLVVRDGDQAAVDAALSSEPLAFPVAVVTGGATRHASEWAALQTLRPTIEHGEVDVVVIHDAARPLASAGLFRDVVLAAYRYGGALPVVDQPGLTTLEVGAEPVPDRVVAVQTPQAFRARLLLDAYTQADLDGFDGTDTASCIERYAHEPVHCVTGDARNIKITFPEDLRLAERLLGSVGQGLPEA